MESEAVLRAAEELAAIDIMIGSANSGSQFLIGIEGSGGKGQVIVTDDESVSLLGQSVAKALTDYRNILVNRLQKLVRPSV